MPILNDLQVLNLTSGLVELHTLDCTGISGAVYRFSPNIWSNGTNIAFQGNTYSYLPVEISGIEVASNSNSTSGGGLPQPTLSVSNVNSVLMDEVVYRYDLVGAIYTRIRTFSKYLDGQPGAANEYNGPDKYVITQKLSHNKSMLAFKLRMKIDLPNAMLPANQALRDSVTGLVKTNPDYDGFPGLSVYRIR